MTTTTETLDRAQQSGNRNRHEVVMANPKVLSELGAPATRAEVWGRELYRTPVHELMAEAVVRRSF